MKNLSSKFILRIFCLMAIFLTCVLSGFAQTDTIAIIDAGSSGSRLFVYRVDKNSKEVSCIDSVGRGPALSSIKEDQNDVDTFLQNIISQSQIPVTNKKLYVLATAGMRKGTEPPSVYNLMKRLQHPKYKVEVAMTISGQYEGLYAWMAANYKELSKPTPALANTKGILEIGGASMQIAFAAKNCTDTTNYIDRNGSKVYSKSYLNGGADSIFYYYGEPETSSYTGDYSRKIAQLPNLRDTIYGLGKPIRGVIAGINKNKTFDNYVKTLNADSFENYHPKSNAYYVQWLIRQLHISVDNIVSKADVNWTKGAAYDIYINEKEPEEFNYRTPN